MIPLKAPEVSQIQVAQAKAPVAVIVCELEQPVSHFADLCVEFALIAIARLTD